MQITEAMLNQREENIKKDIQSIERTRLVLEGALQDVSYFKIKLAETEPTVEAEVGEEFKLEEEKAT